jgi:Fur family peroxide stress response transcriptional regulator
VEKRENFSRKRMAILNTLQMTDVHPTADWVYAQLKPRYPNLSLGTVYRNLKKFCESGKAISVGVINGQEHFDGNTKPHAHFVCRQCGAVLDIHEPFFSEDDLAKLSKRFDLAVENANVIFHGTCQNCKNQPVS